MQNTFRYTLIAFLMCISISSYSHSYTFRGLSVSEGLTDMLVSVIYKDSTGYVWIGTGSSLERFDGVHIKHYPLSGGHEKLKRVNAIAEMSGNRMWMGNAMGLWQLDKLKEEWVLTAPETVNCGINSLLHDGDNLLYIGSEKGLFIYDGLTFERVLIDPNVLSAANSIAGMNLDEAGNLWMVTGKGLFALRLSDRKMTAFPNEPDQENKYFFHHIARIGSTLYLGTIDHGIISFDIGSRQFSPFVSVGCNVISSLSSDGKDLLYVGTDGNGVHFISHGERRVVRSFRHEVGNAESLRSNSVYSLLVDREGIIWVGLFQLGLDYTLYQDSLFSVYSFPPFFDSKGISIRTLSVRGDKKLIGSRDGLFYMDEGRKIFKVFKAPQLRSNMIICCYYFQGEYYIGTYGGGMYVLHPETLTVRDFDAEKVMPFVNGQIFCITADREDNLWIGTSAGLFRYREGRQIGHYTSSNSKLPEGNVHQIYFDSTHKGWICTEKGICIWEPSSQTLKTEVFSEGFIHHELVNILYEDVNHDLYLFPDRGAMLVTDLAMTHFQRLLPGTPLDGRDAMCLVEDKENWLWIGTNNGIFRYNKKDKFIAYSFMNGVPSPVFTSCVPVKDADGSIWFGNSQGLLHLDLSRQQEGKRYAYPLSIVEVYVNGSPSASPLLKKGECEYEVSLAASQKNVTFRFSDFSYTAPEVMAYEYRLEGRDEEWKLLTGKSEVTYYDLPSGSYLFRLRNAGDPDSEITLSVRIASSFPALGVIVPLLVVVLCVGYVYIRRSRKVAEAGTESDEEEGVQVSVQRTEEVTPAAMEEPKLAMEEQKPTAEEPKPILEEKYKTYKIGEKECKQLKVKLEKVMRKEKPYKNPNLKIADLAASVNASPQTLSYLFNQYLNLNYYDYLNDYRIEEFKSLVAQEEYAKYTITALAELCGFSSRASFFRYFKKITGITPNEYIRSMGKGRKE